MYITLNIPILDNKKPPYNIKYNIKNKKTLSLSQIYIFF